MWKQLHCRNRSRAQAAIRRRARGRRGRDVHAQRGPGPPGLGPLGKEERPPAQNPAGGEADEREEQRDVRLRERPKAKHGGELVA